MNIRQRVIARHLEASAMPDSEFWQIVDDIGWGTKTLNYKAGQIALVRRLSREQAKAMHQTFGKLDSALYRVLEPIADATGLGDDGFSDLRAHIIGLGKHEYAANLKDPSRALERARKGAFKESFSYVIPSDTDYDDLSPAAHLRRAKHILDTYYDLLRIRDDVREISTLTGDLNLIVTEMSEFLKSKDPHGLLAQEKQLRASANRVADALSRVRTTGLSYAVGDAIEAGRNPALVNNMLNDVRDFLA